MNESNLPVQFVSKRPMHSRKDLDEWLYRAGQWRVVSTVAYEPLTEILEVLLSTGRTYRYHNIDVATANAFLQADSLSDHFAMYIVPHYPVIVQKD